MTAEEFLKSLPNLSDGVLQQEYLKKSELHETIISAMKLLEEETQATRLIDLTFQVNPKFSARLAGAATSTVEKAVSQKFKNLVEDRVKKGEIYSEIDLLGETLAIWAIPDLEQFLHRGYFVYKAGVALTRIATQKDNTTAQDAAISALSRGLDNSNGEARSILIKQLMYIRRDPQCASEAVREVTQLALEGATHW